MNKELSHLLKGKLFGLPFIDLLAGMAQTVSRQDPVDQETMITKKFPVTYDHNDDACKGKEVELIPDSRRKCIIYFEDFGANVIDKKHGLWKYQSSLRLICWMNRAKLVGNVYTDISGAMISTIVNKLAFGPFNEGIFRTLSVKVAKIQPQDAALFGKYTYTETDRQYLRPPFEFFGIDFLCDYFVNPKCLDTLPWNTQVCS